MSKLIEQFTVWVKRLSRNLYLSITSSDFYAHLYITRKVYGFHYLLNLCIISSTLLCSYLIIQAHHQKQILDSGSYYKNTMPDLQHYASVNNKTDLVLSDIDLSYLISQFPSLQYDGESISYDGEIPFYIKSHNGANVISIDLSTDYGMPNQATLVPVVFTKKWLNLSFLNLRGQIEASLPLEYKSIFGDAPGVIDQSTIRGVLSEYFTYAPRIIIYTFFPILTCFLFAVAILQNLPTILILLFVSLFFYKNVSWKGCACIVIFSAASLTIAQSLIFLIAPVLLGQKWILGLWVNFLVVIGFFKALKFTKSSALI